MGREPGEQLGGPSDCDVGLTSAVERQKDRGWGEIVLGCGLSGQAKGGPCANTELTKSSDGT